MDKERSRKLQPHLENYGQLKLLTTGEMSLSNNKLSVLKFCIQITLFLWKRLYLGIHMYICIYVYSNDYWKIAMILKEIMDRYMGKHRERKGKEEMM